MNRERLCAACGAQARSEADFCRNCGRRLAEAQAPQPSAQQRTMPAPTSASVASSSRRSPPGRRRWPALPVALLLLLLLGGAAAALTVPVMALNADRPLGEMLPAGTVFYVSANLHPTEADKENLDRIERAWSEQPGWSHLASLYNGTFENSKQDSARCYRQTRGQVENYTADLGQDTALAMTSARGVRSSGALANNLAALKRDVVVLAPLHKSMTLLEALRGLSFSLPQKSFIHHGVTIYQEIFTACGKASRGKAQTVYAAMTKNWVVLGATPEALFPVIESSDSSRRTLSSDATYKRLMSTLPARHLGSYFLSGKAIAQTGLFKQLQSTAHVPTSSYRSATQASVAAALTADAQGLTLLAGSYNPVGKPTTFSAAGSLASTLPSSTLAFVSLAGLQKNLDAGIKQLRPAVALSRDFRKVLHALASSLSGEADLVLLRPTSTQVSPSRPSTIPLALLWQVKNSRVAARDLDSAARTLGLAKQFKKGGMSDGTTYHAASAAFGYAVRQGWAVLALNVKQTLEMLASHPASALATSRGYRAGVVGGQRPADILYFDVRGLRVAVQNTYLRTTDPNTRSSYNKDVKPSFAPIQSISGSAGTSEDGKSGSSRLKVEIASPAGT